MNIVETLIAYRKTQDQSLFESSSEFESGNLNSIAIEVLAWLKLERKRELWIEAGKKCKLKPLELNTSYDWSNDLIRLVGEGSVFSGLFSVKDNMLSFKEDIAECYRHELRSLADKEYNPQMIIS